MIDVERIKAFLNDYEQLEWLNRQSDGRHQWNYLKRQEARKKWNELRDDMESRYNVREVVQFGARLQEFVGILRLHERCEKAPNLLKHLDRYIERHPQPNEKTLAKQIADMQQIVGEGSYDWYQLREQLRAFVARVEER